MNPQRADLDALIRAFQAWLYLPDPGALEIVVASYAANRLPGDAVWLMVVGSPSSGKGEMLNPCVSLPFVHTAATITEAALLSGSSSKSRSAKASGGLLMEIGDFGVLVLKDFTSILAMNRDTRASLLAALREIFDGSWERKLGVDGGLSLKWRGKLGIICGVTEAIDTAHSVMAAMGPRFVLYRLPKTNAREQARRALDHTQDEEQMREELQAEVSHFFRDLEETIKSAQPIELTDAEREWLITLTELASVCRSHVERNGKDRHIELVPNAEGPARMTRTLAQLLAGMRVVGIAPKRQRVLLRKVALDSIPPVRRNMLDHLISKTQPQKTSAIAASARLPVSTVRIALEDLAAHGVLELCKHDGAEAWTVAAEWKDRLRAVYA